MFYDNLKAACEKANVKMTPIVKECGGSTGSIGPWKKGAFPNSELVIKLAARLNVSTDFLLTGDHFGEALHTTDEEKDLLATFKHLDDVGKKMVVAASCFASDYLSDSLETENISTSQNPERRAINEDIRQFVVYDMPTSAGTYRFLDSEEYTLMDLPDSDIPTNATFGVRIAGDSMSPEIDDGDIVFVRQQPDIEENEIGIFVLRGGECYCKQYIRHNGQPALMPLNSDYELIEIGEFDEVRVVGKVIGVLDN